MKRLFFMVFAVAAFCAANAGVKYFQAPSDTLLSGMADVYFDVEFPEGRIPDKRDSLRMALQQAEIDKALDYKGRYAVWDMIPDYIYAPEADSVTSKVRIFVSDKSYGLDQDTTLHDGKYTLKYLFDCRYEVSSPDGKVLREKDLGTVAGYAESATLQLSESLPAATIAALNNAYIYARNDVYANFGFSVMETVFDLKNIPTMPSLNERAEEIESMVANMQGLVRDDALAEKIREYVDSIALHEETLPVAGRAAAMYNVAVCKAMAGDQRAAADAFGKYAGMLSSFADSAAYCAVRQFVEHYPVSTAKYARIMSFLDSDIFRFVCFYAYNDVISKVFGLPFTFPFLQYVDYDTRVSSVSGSVKIPGNDSPMEYAIAFNESGRPVKFTAERMESDKTYGRNKLKTNDLYITYNKKDGRFKGISTVPMRLVRLFMPFHDTSGIDSLSSVASFTTQNVLGSFMKMKCETVETVSAALDPGGDIHFKGSSLSSRPTPLFNYVAACNNVEFPLAFSEFSNEFEKEVSFDANGMVHGMTSKAEVLYEKNRGDYNYGYMRSDSMAICMDTYFVDGKKYISYKMEVPVSVGWNRKTQWCVPGLFGDDAEASVSGKQSHGGKQSATYTFEAVWPVETVSDHNGNWIKMKVGPYEFERTLQYR